MGSACVRCSEPASETLCTACAARLRALLAGRPGVRRSAQRASLPPYGLAIVLTMALLGGLARILIVTPEPGPPTASGVWQVFAEQQFVSPLGMAVDRDGNLFVGDTGNDRVQKLSPIGQTIAVWGRAGAGPGEFRQPYGVALDGEGSVYIADHWNNRIQKVSPGGVVVAQWGSYGWTAGQFNNPRAVAVDSHGDVFVADSYNHRIQKLSGSGLPVLEWGMRGGVAGQFRRPEGLVVDDHGGLVVVDSDNARLQRYVPTP